MLPAYSHSMLYTASNEEEMTLDELTMVHGKRLAIIVERKGVGVGSVEVL